MAWTEGKETTREAIDAKVKIIGGDMLKIEYFENCLKNPQQQQDVRRYVLIKLSGLYEGRLMFGEAAKQMDAAAAAAVTFKDKMELYMLATQLSIKHGDYVKADDAFKKALASANTREREELKQKIKILYLARSRDFEKSQRFNNAIKVIEKLFSMNILTESERQAEQKRLANFYARIGKIPEAMRLGG